MAIPRDALRGGVSGSGLPPVEWRAEPGLIGYERAVADMEARAAAIAAGIVPELVWLVEHPPLYTAGTSARSGQLIDARFPVHVTGRGGQFTYHGPGQRVVYAMLNLATRGNDLRRYVAALEEWVIRTLAAFGVAGERREDRVGVWVRRPDKGEGHEDKIAAIGIRVKRWVSLHGLALNVDPDLAHFGGIVPCGVADDRYGITSLRALGVRAGLAEVDRALHDEFERLFGAAAGQTVERTLKRDRDQSTSRI